MHLFPAEYYNLVREQRPLRLTEPFIIRWAEQAPLEVLQAYREGKMPPDLLRLAAESAIVSGHVDGAAMFVEVGKLLAATETSRTRSAMSGMLGIPAEIEWFHATRKIAPVLGRQAAWFMARDYLSGRYDFNTTNVLPMQEKSAEQVLNVAYCLQQDYPDIAHTIVQQNLPLVLTKLEQSFDQPYRVDHDLSMVAWFDPQAAHALLIKLGQQLEEERKKPAPALPPGQPAQPGQPVQPAIPNPHEFRLQVMSVNLTRMRESCLRGLLLERL